MVISSSTAVPCHGIHSDQPTRDYERAEGAYPPNSPAESPHTTYSTTLYILHQNNNIFTSLLLPIPPHMIPTLFPRTCTNLHIASLPSYRGRLFSTRIDATTIRSGLSQKDFVTRVIVHLHPSRGLKVQFPQVSPISAFWKTVSHTSELHYRRRRAILTISCALPKGDASFSLTRTQGSPSHRLSF